MIIGRLLGIDHGMKRIGVAVSDPTGLLAREVAIIQRKSKHEDFARLNALASENGVVALVIGLPLDDADSDPNRRTQAAAVRRWVEHLQATTPLPIILWDERLSTADAQELARLHRRKPGLPVDDLAARVILQSYLDALREGLAQPPPAL